MTILIIVVFLTILISANCSLYEATLYSTRLGVLEAAKSKGENAKLAQKLIFMKKTVSEPIAAILILNTIANTAGATIAGMYAAEVLGVALMPIFSVGFTLAILFLAEIMPKTVGAVHWRKLWPLVVVPLQLMKTGLYPVIRITEKFTTLFSKTHKIPPITEDEILAMVHIGTKAGEITADEGRMVRNIIHLEDRQVQEIMTPRRMIFSIDGRKTISDAAQALQGKGVSRIPIYEGEKENIIGYVMAQEVLSSKTFDRPDTPLKSLVKPVSFVRETSNCLSLLTSFLKHRRHIAIVVDEYNGVDGVVTLEDLLETMLGTEIVDETDRVVDLQEAARERKVPRPPAD